MKSDEKLISAPALNAARIWELGDWHGEKIALVRRLIHEADSDIIEELNWRGTPVRSHDGIVCTSEAYKQGVKLPITKGASLVDAHYLFNAGLTGNVHRANDRRAKFKVTGPLFQDLIREAVAYNLKHPPRDVDPQDKARSADEPSSAKPCSVPSFYCKQ